MDDFKMINIHCKVINSHRTILLLSNPYVWGVSQGRLLIYMLHEPKSIDAWRTFSATRPQWATVIGINMVSSWNIMSFIHVGVPLHALSVHWPNADHFKAADSWEARRISDWNYISIASCGYSFGTVRQKLPGLAPKVSDSLERQTFLQCFLGFLIEFYRAFFVVKQPRCSCYCFPQYAPW